MNMLGDRRGNGDTIYREWDFASGKREYEPEIARKMRVAWNTLLFGTIEQELPEPVMRSLYLKVIIGQSYFLNYQGYARFLYNNHKSLYTASASREEINEYENLKQLFTSFQTNDEGIMRFFHATHHDQPQDT